MKSSGGGLPVGTTFDFPYKGEVQEVTLPKGTYKLECWGAQGGVCENNYSEPENKGGYSYGTLVLDTETTLYVFVGGQGKKSGNGGWNGGGYCDGYTEYDNTDTFGCTWKASGGGATDICTVSSDMAYVNGRTNRSEKSLLSRIIVAGGGGGTTYGRYYPTYQENDDWESDWSFVQWGGGLEGNSEEEGYGGGQFGTTLSGYFGVGANNTNTHYMHSGGGGGGGWMGGMTDWADDDLYYVRRSGGGSGWVNIPSSASNRPIGYNAPELESGNTIGGNTVFLSPDGVSETGHSGDGYARITVISASSGGGSSVSPNNYTEVEYIESSGNAYVNTNVYPSKNTRVKIDFAFTHTAFQQRIFGNRDSSNTDFCFESYISGVGEYAWSCANGNGNWTQTNVMADTNRHEIDLDSYNNQVSVDGGSSYITGITTTRTITSDYPIYLASTNRMDEGYMSDRTAYIRIYGCQIFEGAILVRDYVPVKRKSDGVYGLFDKVNSVFYPSVSGTNFTGA